MTDWTQPAGSHLVSPLLWKPQEARTFGKGSPRPFLEQGTSRLRLLPRFLHPSRPACSSPLPGARGLTWRGVSASHPRPGTCERRTNSNLPRLTHPRLGAGGGSGVSGDSHKVSPPGTRRRRGAIGVPVRVRVSVSARSSPPLTSGKKLSIVPAPAPSRLSSSCGSQRSGRSREATRVTVRLGATPARGAAALPSPSRCCSSAPFVRVSDLLRPNRSLCLSFLQVPHFWAKCSRAENSWWHILPGLGEGRQGAGDTPASL